ncbi:MAG: YncE family protein [Chloroflexota bacterium]
MSAPQTDPSTDASPFGKRSPVLVALLLTVAAGVLIRCAPPDSGSAVAAPVLYVANAGAGTVTRLDAASGYPVGPSLMAGTAPTQIVAGADGNLLIAGATAGHGGSLTALTRQPGGWQARPVRLEPGAHRLLIAGDGGRHAVVAYHVSDAASDEGESHCRLAVVDLATGRVEPARTVCAGRDSVVGLALDEGFTSHGAGDAGPGATAYLAIWRRPAAEDDCSRSSGSRILATRIETGAVLAVAPIDGAPGSLALAPAPGTLGRRLYTAEAQVEAGQALPDECRYMSHDDHDAAAARWSVLGLNPTTLETESRWPVSQPWRSFAIAPDGDHAYALAGQGTVTHLDLLSGAASQLIKLPKIAISIAVTADRVYVPDAFGDGVWVVHRRNGRLRQTISTGHHPVAVTLGSSRLFSP